MKIRIILGLIFLGLSLSSCDIFRRSAKLRVDTEAEAFMEDGKRFLRSKKYITAMDAFEMAYNREPHPQTSAALYFTGLSAYYAGYLDIAEKKFNDLLSIYNRSKYIEEATYHLALIDLDSRITATRKAGVKRLIRIAKGSRNKSLIEDANLHIREAFFNSFTQEELSALKPEMRGIYRTYLEEALLYQLIQNQQIEEAKIEYQAYRLLNGELTDYMSLLLGEQTELNAEKSYLTFEPEVLRIALCLPLHHDHPLYGYNDQVPRKMTLGLEFYEGFSRAITDFEARTSKKVYFRVFDTKRDTSATLQLLTPLDNFAPTILVGAIYNAQSRILSKWAEDRRVAQIIPISPTESLVQDKQYTFLGHPGSTTHGMRMAEYAYDGLGLRQVYIFTDWTSGTAELTKGFANQFLSMGGQVDTFQISRYYKTAIKEIPKHIKEMSDGEDTVGVYIPLLGNEESAGLIINLLRQRGQSVKIMGSPHFRARYEAISRDIKEAYQVLFTTSHLVEEDTAYLAFHQAYLRDFGYPPSETVIQGYDLAAYLLSQLDRFDPSLGYPVNTFLRSLESQPTLHIDYLFKGAQSNQAVNIGQYQEGGIIRVNR